MRLCSRKMLSRWGAILSTWHATDANTVYKMKNPDGGSKLIFDATDRCGDFFNIKNHPDREVQGTVTYCILNDPVLQPWIDEGKDGILMAMEKGTNGGNPHAMCVHQDTVCRSILTNHQYSEECTDIFVSCRSALRHLHEMMINKPPSRQICNNFARKSIRGFFHDFMSNAIDGSILAEHDISMNFGLCRWAQYINVLSDDTFCDPGSIIAMAGELGYVACGVDLYNLDSEVKPDVTINRPFPCGSNIHKSPLFNLQTMQRREQFSDAQLATNSTAMEEFWYSANGHTHGRPDGEIEYSAEAAGAAHAIGRVTCPPDGATNTGNHPPYKTGFFHEFRGNGNDVEGEYKQGIRRLSQTQCDFSDDDSPQPHPEGIRPSTEEYPITNKETDFNAEGGFCSMPTQFLSSIHVGSPHRVPRWVSITEHSSKLWSPWSDYQSECRRTMSMYVPLELLTITDVELPQSEALKKFENIAWDGYDSIDSKWDSCTVGCAIPILENRLCGGTTGLSKYDWELDYCHEGSRNSDGTICCDNDCEKCSKDNVEDRCNSKIIGANARECISARDTICTIPRKGDGAICTLDSDCKSATCKDKCCNISGVGNECIECGILGGQCIKCRKGYKLEGTSCIDKCACSAGCTDCDCGICRACDSASYFLEGKKCQLKRGEGKVCGSSKECVSGSCFGGYCCKESVVSSCKACNNRGKCASCLSGYTLCGHHGEGQGFCKPTVSTKVTTFRCGTGGKDTDYPSSDGYNYCEQAGNCPCARAGCYMECEIEKTCWIGSIADSLTKYNPVFVCKSGNNCEKSCAGLNRKFCGKNDQCKYGPKKNVAMCVPKSQQFKHDCSKYSSKRGCLAKGLCRYRKGGCHHRCSDLKKNPCRKQVKGVSSRKICKYSKIENPCFGCNPVSEC